MTTPIKNAKLQEEITMDAGINTGGYVANEMYDRINYGSGRGYGGLYAGNEVLAANAHADGTALKESVDCNADRFSDGLARVSEQNKEQGCNDREHRANDRATNTEFRTGDRLRDLEREMGQNAAAAAKCCCDAQLQACKDHADLKALVISENSATRELIRGDALAAANARITQLETINALSGNSHHGGGH